MVEVTRKLITFEEMDLPAKLYKYRDWDDAFHKTILTNQEIYFAKPSSFEDPLDCKIPIRYDLLTDDEIYQKYFAFSIKENPRSPVNLYSQPFIYQVGKQLKLITNHLLIM